MSLFGNNDLCQYTRLQSKKGFTLIELVIVMLILSTLGIATSSYIATGLNIYNGISERDKSLNSIRFVMERMRRDVSNALPNSIRVEDDCLTFYPIKNSSLYTSFPIYPIQKNSAEMTAITDYSYTSGDRAVVYLLHESELSIFDSNGSSKSQLISGVNSAKDTLNFSNNISFPLSSPAKRIYIINDNLSYCFSGEALYWQKNSGEPVLMAENVSGSFAVIDATLQRNSLVEVNFSLPFDDQEVAFEQTLHINNVP